MKRRNLNLNHFSKTIPAKANGVNGNLELNVSGVRLLCKESDDTFLLSIDDSPFIPFEVGLSFDLTEDPQYQSGDIFKKLTLQNDTATDIDVVIYTMGPGLKDARLNTLVSRTISVGAAEPATFAVGGGRSLPAAATDTFTGLNGGGRRRKHIVLANADTDNTLDLYDGNDVHCGYLFPIETLPLALSGTIKVKNNNVGAVNYSALEIYYVDI